MSLILQASSLGYRYCEQKDPLIESLDLTLYTGDHVALLGANGTGKTTLLGLLAGTLPLQSGQLTRHIEPLYLQQEDRLTGEARVLDAVVATYPDLGALRAQLRALEAAGVPDPLTYTDLLAAFAERGGYDLEVALQAELGALGYDDGVLERPLASLSGGERRLLRLVAAFARPTDPTGALLPAQRTD